MYKLNVYHIDRGHALFAGQTLNLIRPNTDYDYQLQYIDALFPNGKISVFGDVYSYPDYNQPKDNYVYLQETIFELVRQKWFPQMPSRFQSFFSLSSINDVKQWLSFFVNESNRNPIIWEVEVSDIVTLDAGWRDLKNVKTDFDAAYSYHTASQYWSKIYKSGFERRLENLSPFPVKVVKPVDIFEKRSR